MIHYKNRVSELSSIRNKAIARGFQMSYVRCRHGVACQGRFGGYHIGIFGHGVRKNMSLMEAHDFLADWPIEHGESV